MKLYLFKSLLFTLLVFSIVGCEEKDFTSSLSEDEAEMSGLRKEIDRLSEQVNCENSADWKFVAIGSKSCGGSTGFVVYSTKIDEALFLKKVTIYNQKQKAFNVKWNRMSDCALSIPPKSVECIGGKPKLVY